MFLACRLKSLTSMFVHDFLPLSDCSIYFSFHYFYFFISSSVRFIYDFSSSGILWNTFSSDYLQTQESFSKGLNHGFGSGSAWIRFFADPDPDPKRPGSGSVCIFSVAEQIYLFSAPAWLQFFHYFGSGSSFASSP